jgi:hypothetical protein
MVAAFFIVGVGLTLGIAHRLGAFDDPDGEMKRAAANAEAALSAAAWDAPPGKNVREITDGALSRWPGAEPILDVRRRAARALVTQARAIPASDAASSQRLVKLALELDPGNAQARLLDAELATAGLQSDVAAAPPHAAAKQAPESPAGPAKPRGRTERGVSKAAVPPAAPAPPPPAPAPTPAPAESGAPPPGGRWL